MKLLVNRLASETYFDKGISGIFDVDSIDGAKEIILKDIHDYLIGGCDEESVKFFEKYEHLFREKIMFYSPYAFPNHKFTSVTYTIWQEILKDENIDTSKLDEWNLEESFDYEFYTEYMLMEEL